MRLLLNSRTYSSLRGLSVKKTCSDGAPTLSFSVRSARFLKLLYMPASHPSRAPETRISISGTTHRAVRMFSNDTNATGEVSGRFTASEPSIEEYHRISNETMEDLLAYLEEIIYSESSGENGWEVDYNSGVMTINFGPTHGTYVINKQPPNRQIWLSSPISGPKRYDYDAKAETWFYSRDGVSLGELLTQEFETIVAGDVNVPLR